MDENSRNSYLFQAITSYSPKVLCLGSARHRKMSLYYSVVVGARRIYVCKKAFVQLHQITNSKVDHTRKQITVGKTAPSPVRRGKHKNRPHRLDSAKVDDVKCHIQQFPAEMSHYSRNNNPNRQYLSPWLNISMMYCLYKDSCRERGVEPVSLPSYCFIFCNNFNLGFGTPKSDTCAVCDASNKTAHTAHKQLAEQAFEAQKQDRLHAQFSDDTFMIIFDLQKTLPLPKLSTSIAFYLRQIWLYNLGIHLTCKDQSQPYFSIWTEADGSRGCSEVASCILAFVDSANIPHGSHLIAWSLVRQLLWPEQEFFHHWSLAVPGQK